MPEASAGTITVRRRFVMKVSMDPKAKSDAQVVVCVPTFRRRERLIRLLSGILEQDYSGLFAIVIADNDSENPTMTSLDIPTNLADRLSWFVVQERGVAIVRNRLVEFALQHFPAAKWLAFIDDDEVPSSSWLRLLIGAALSHGGDLVGGPVLGRLPENASNLARRSVYVVRRPQPSGPVDMLIGTNNLLISATFLRSLKRQPFLAEFGRTGGEDYEFLRHAKSKGAQFCWSEEATVWEDVEPHRLTAAALLKRYVGVGSYHARIDRRYLDWNERVRNLFQRLRWLAAAATRSVGGIETKKNSAEAVLAMAAVTGYIIGLCGVRIKLY